MSRSAHEWEAIAGDLIERIRDAALVFAVPADTRLFSQSDPTTGLLLIEEGLVSLSRLESNGLSVIVRVCGPRTLLGLAAAITEAPHALTATTQTSARLRVLGPKSLRELMTAVPALVLALLRHLSVENLQHAVRCGELGCLSARERLTRVLIEHGEGDTAPVRVGVPAARLPMLVGVDPSHLFRLLRAFRREQLIDTIRGRIVILDPEKLRASAGVERAIAAPLSPPSL